MRHLYCHRPACGGRLTPGRRLSSPAGRDGPAEWERVIRGYAAIPTSAQRTVRVNGTAVALAPLHYDCDFCGAAIPSGSPATAITEWQPSRQPEPPYWELEYLTDPTPSPAALADVAARILEQEPRP